MIAAAKLGAIKVWATDDEQRRCGYRLQKLNTKQHIRIEF